MSSRVLAVSFMAVVVIACDKRRSARDASHVRDSAGVRIVENERPAWRAGEAWRLGNAPMKELGAKDSLFGIGNAIRLHDGRIIVSHKGANEILIYSSTGQLESRFGRAGSGPGEFQEVSRMLLTSGQDSLLVFDLPQRKVSVFDLRGGFTRSFLLRPTPNGMPALVDGAFADGSLLVASTTPLTLAFRGLVRPRRSLWRYAADGTPVTRLIEIAGQETFFQDTPFGVDMRRPFFGQTSYYLAWKDRFYWGVTDRFEINVQSQTGQLLSVIRKKHPSKSVTTAAVDELIRRQVASVGVSAKEPVRQALSRMPAAGKLPAFGWPVWADRFGAELQVDDEGNLWVAKYFEPNAPGNARTIFDANGRWLGTVRLPSRFTPLHLGAHLVLGKWLDDVDVEHLQLCELIKPSK